MNIPSPRSSSDDGPVLDLPEPERVVGEGAENGLVEPEFRYEPAWLRGRRRRYNGYVEWVGGAEGKRLRGDLTATVRDLLDWAARHDSANDRELESEKDFRSDAA